MNKGPTNAIEPAVTAPCAAKRPELLAPAGDETCLLAAVENGADAVYFGLKGHNARARAANFDLEDLPRIMATLHRRGVRGYVTLNTLVFPGELADLESIVRQVTEAGVDALIVQDLGVCRLIRALSPDLEIHASTQMSITSAAGVRMAAELGCSRVILARELSLRQIEKVIREAVLPVEVFVHGALCVAYSGQCLTSEALGGRSANRGECAQACRMAYDLICDGRQLELGDVRYLLSPQDLAAYDLVPRLVGLGLASLKIEGRLKAPEYVANITAQYRRAIDAAVRGESAQFSRRDVHDMEMSFSRGFSHGFLDGSNHKVLVRGDYAKKRGVFLGRVESIGRDGIGLTLGAPLKPGDGVVLDGDEPGGPPEQGGRVYRIEPLGRAARGGPGTVRSAFGSIAAGRVIVGFGRHDIDLKRVRIGQRVWKTDDPELTRRLRQSFEGPPRRLVALDVRVTARVGEPLHIEGRTATGYTAAVVSEAPLEPARTEPADHQMLREQLERLGGTAYRLGRLEAEIDGGPMIPRSLVNRLRRELVANLDAQAASAPARRNAASGVLSVLRAAIPRTELCPGDRAAPTLAVLCREDGQIGPALEAGARTIYLDYQHIKRYADSVALIRRRAPDAEVWLAPPRVEKPGEENLPRALARAGADGMLVRNAGNLAFCVERGIPFVADFSLNAANELTVGFLKARGASRVTASYDLNFDQLRDLIAAVPPGWLEVVLHQHMPMFHMEHCVFCAVLSPGTDKTNCGRPCDRHEVRLRDRVGMEHPLKADIGCRNTLFNAVPQTAAEFLPALVASGVGTLRVEFLDDGPSEVAKTLRLYREAIDGRRDARTLWKDLKAINRYGVTRGQLAVL